MPETISSQITGTRLLYPRKVAAFQLGISVRSLDYLISAREIAVRRNGSRILVPHGELIRFARADHHQAIRPQTQPDNHQAA